MLIWDDQTWISGALGAAELEAASEAGVRLVIELRDHGEPDRRGLTPSELRRAAEALGIVHRHVPIVVERPCEGPIDEVARLLDAAPGRTLIVCASGRRAVVVLSAIAGRRGGWRGDETARRVAALGFDLTTMPLLQDALVRYVARGTGSDAHAAGGGLDI
jgi:uncharacterized protein (TIGR01244 family)